MKGNRVSITNLETGEQHTMDAGILFIPDQLTFSPGDFGPVLPIMFPQEETSYEITIENCDPSLMALVTDDPWMEVWARQRQQFDAMKAMA